MLLEIFSRDPDHGVLCLGSSSRQSLPESSFVGEADLPI